MKPRQLVAYINQARVGILEDRKGVWRFQYDADWCEFPLSPSLPVQEAPHIDGSSDRPVQWYFDNLLPEEGQRLLLAKEAHLDHADAFGLLSYYGAESAGSVTLLPPDQRLPEQDRLRPLPDHQLDDRIRQLPRISLAQGSAKRMSLAGAQHKLAVIMRDDSLHEPIGHHHRQFPSMSWSCHECRT